MLDDLNGRWRREVDDLAFAGKRATVQVLVTVRAVVKGMLLNPCRRLIATTMIVLGVSLATRLGFRFGRVGFDEGGRVRRPTLLKLSNASEGSGMLLLQRGNHLAQHLILSSKLNEFVLNQHVERLPQLSLDACDPTSGHLGIIE
jgi:hypothetical protein